MDPCDSTTSDLPNPEGRFRSQYLPYKIKHNVKAVRESENNELPFEGNESAAIAVTASLDGKTFLRQYRQTMESLHDLGRDP